MSLMYRSYSIMFSLECPYAVRISESGTFRPVLDLVLMTVGLSLIVMFLSYVTPRNLVVTGIGVLYVCVPCTNCCDSRYIPLCYIFIY